MNKKAYKLFSKHTPYLFGLAVSILILAMTAKTYTWIKTYGDFATKAFVLQAQAQCNQKAEDDLHRHENWESGQLKTLNDKIDQIYLILIKKG